MCFVKTCVSTKVVDGGFVLSDIVVCYNVVCYVKSALVLDRLGITRPARDHDSGVRGRVRYQTNASRGPIGSRPRTKARGPLPEDGWWSRVSSTAKAAARRHLRPLPHPHIGATLGRCPTTSLLNSSRCRRAVALIPQNPAQTDPRSNNQSVAAFHLDCGSISLWLSTPTSRGIVS